MYLYQQKLKKVIQVFSCFVLFIPIFISSEYLFPYMHLKNLIFRLLILVLFLLTTWLVFERGYINGKRNYVLYGFVALIIISLLASLFGLNPSNSLWSNYERMDGWFNLLAIFTYFFILLQVFESKSEWLWLLRSSVAGALLVAFNGLLQIGGVENKWVTGGSNVRIAATIGNAAFFAAYMMFNFFFAIILAYLEKDTWQKILYAITGLFFLSMIYYSATRGPVVGLVVSIFVMSILYWPRAVKKQKLFIASLALLMVLFGGLLYSQRNSDWIKNYSAFNRIANISLEDATTYDRLLVWQTSWQGFLDRPILGYGLENYKYSFNKYYNPNIHERWFDRAHNVIFDYLNTSGILGFLSYLALLFFGIRYFWKSKDNNYVLNILFIGGLVAYFIQNLFVFDTLNTYLPLVLILAISGFYYFNFANNEENENNAVKEENIKWNITKKILGLKPFIMGLLLILVIIFSNIFVIKPAQANLTAINAYGLQNIDPQESFDLFQKALAMDTYGNREIIIQLHDFTNRTLKNNQSTLEFKKELFAYTNDQMLSILDGDPHDLQFRSMLAALYQTYSSIDPVYLEKSIEMIKPGFADSPDRLELYYVLAQGHVMNNELDQAVNLLEEALLITDKVKGTYSNIINVYSLTKNQAKVLEYSEDYVNKFDLTTENKRNLVKFYYQAELYERAGRLLVDEVIIEDPANAENYNLLVAIFTALDDPDSGIYILNQLIGFYPSWEEALQTYIDELNKVKIQ